MTSRSMYSMKSCSLSITMLLNTMSLLSIENRRIHSVDGVELKIPRMMFRTWNLLKLRIIFV